MTRFFHALFAASQDDPESASVIPQGPPRSLWLETGVFPAMCGVRYTVSRGTVTRIRHGIRSQRSRREPAPEEWHGFWAAVERLGVRHWRAEFPPTPQTGVFPFDRKGWGFRPPAGVV